MHIGSAMQLAHRRGDGWYGDTHQLSPRMSFSPNLVAVVGWQLPVRGQEILAEHID